MSRFRPTKRTSGKRNDRNEDNPNFTLPEEENPAWQSNSKIGSRARVMNGTATYTWKFGDETGGLEKNDLKKEPVKGQVGNFNAVGVPYLKNRIKSKVASEGALKRNNWVKFVKKAQQSWETHFNSVKTYPCIIADPIIQLMYHARNITSSTKQAKVNRVPPEHYPFIFTDDMVDEYQKQGINYFEYLKQSPDTIVGTTQKINVFDTIDKKNDFRNIISDRYSAVTEPGVSKNPEETLPLPESPEEEGYGFDIPSYPDTSISYGEEETKEDARVYDLSINEILSPKNLPRIRLPNSVKELYSQNFLFAPVDDPTSPIYFTTNDLQTLFDPTKTNEANYNSWLNIGIITAFINSREYDVADINMLLITPYEFVLHFQSNKNSSEEFNNALKNNRAWIIIPVKQERNDHWYMITVTKVEDAAAVHYNVGIYDSLFNANNKHSKFKTHKEHVEFIAQKMNFLYQDQPMGYTVHNESTRPLELPPHAERKFYYAHERMSEGFDLADWPRQPDGVSCGVFTILFLLHVTQQSIATTSAGRVEMPPDIRNLKNLSNDVITNVRRALVQYITNRYQKFTREEYNVYYKRRIEPHLTPEDLSTMILEDESERSFALISEPVEPSQRRSLRRKRKTEQFTSSFDAPKPKLRRQQTLPSVKKQLQQPLKTRQKSSIQKNQRLSNVSNGPSRTSSTATTTGRPQRSTRTRFSNLSEFV